MYGTEKRAYSKTIIKECITKFKILKNLTEGEVFLTVDIPYGENDYITT